VLCCIEFWKYKSTTKVGMSATAFRSLKAVQLTCATQPEPHSITKVWLIKKLPFKS